MGDRKHFQIQNVFRKEAVCMAEETLPNLRRFSRCWNVFGIYSYEPTFAKAFGWTRWNTDEIDAECLGAELQPDADAVLWCKNCWMLRVLCIIMIANNMMPLGSKNILCCSIRCRDSSYSNDGKRFFLVRVIFVIIINMYLFIVIIVSIVIVIRYQYSYPHC